MSYSVVACWPGAPTPPTIAINPDDYIVAEGGVTLKTRYFWRLPCDTLTLHRLSVEYYCCCAIIAWFGMQIWIVGNVQSFFRDNLDAIPSYPFPIHRFSYQIVLTIQRFKRF